MVQTESTSTAMQPAVPACSQCGADELSYDPASQGLVCKYCQHQQPLEARGPAPVEHSLQVALQQQLDEASQGYGVEVRSVECDNCGARVNFTGKDTSKRCDFCDSPHVLEKEAHRNVIRPESLVPFSVDQNRAKDSFKGWLAGLWFRPSDLQKKAAVGAVVGVYVPYWTYDADVHSSWTAEAGHYYYEEETYTATENGEQVEKTREVRKTRWEPASGRRDDHYDDMLVVASKGLPKEIADRFRSFDTNLLRPYDPQYLAGWRAEEYAVDLRSGWTEAATRMEQSQERRCAGDVPGDTHRSLDVHNTFSAETFKHVLLPIFIASYRYNDEVFRFLVNGQTGEVQGEAPYSWIKIALTVLLVIAVLVGIYYGVVLSQQ